MSVKVSYDNIFNKSTDQTSKKWTDMTWSDREQLRGQIESSSGQLKKIEPNQI